MGGIYLSCRMQEGKGKKRLKLTDHYFINVRRRKCMGEMESAFLGEKKGEGEASFIYTKGEANSLKRSPIFNWEGYARGGGEGKLPGVFEETLERHLYRKRGRRGIIRRY